ncbi:MAG: four helix bundle protein [Rickettsiales bacterium]|jgi:four helix bundle protein|nr:four helix bundle protein [Rickettsiales bacterium]
MLPTEELEVFKRTHIVALTIYNIISKFPKDEIYGLSSQMRRAAISINSNLMEGNARRTDGERKQFIGISRGSAAELQYQVMLARDLNLITKNEAEKLIDELKQIGRILSKLMSINIKPSSCS